MRPHLWLIQFIGLIVPRRLRADWRQEWEAELRYRELLLAEWDRLDWRHKLDLLWLSTSAFWDALWLQPKRLEDEVIQDLRYGARMLRTHKTFTGVALLTLAVGIGASTAIFSLAYSLLLRALPYPEAERLATISLTNTLAAAAGFPRFNVNAVNWMEWRSQSKLFAIRTALGAQANDVRRLVLGHTALLWLAGSAIGLVAAWPVGRALQSQLYGVGSDDAVALAVAPSLLLVTALIAGLGPARRAGRVDPAVTLRSE